MNAEKDSGGVWFTNIPTALTPGEDPHLQALTLLCPLTGQGRRGVGGWTFSARVWDYLTPRGSQCVGARAQAQRPRAAAGLFLPGAGAVPTLALCARVPKVV